MKANSRTRLIRSLAALGMAALAIALPHAASAQQYPSKPIKLIVPLGVGGHTFESLDIELEDDSLLVLCTDGLVESRAPGRDIDDGLGDLAREIKDATLPLEAIADTVIAGLRGDRTMDDAALVIARVRGGWLS